MASYYVHGPKLPHMADLSEKDDNVAERNTGLTSGIMVGGAMVCDFKPPLVVMWSALLILLYHCHLGCKSYPS